MTFYPTGYANVTFTMDSTTATNGLVYVPSTTEGAGQSFVVNSYPVQPVALEPPKPKSAVDWLRGEVDTMCQYAFA